MFVLLNEILFFFFFMLKIGEVSLKISTFNISPRKERDESHWK